MNYPKLPLAQIVIALCKDYEVRDIIISPGSRNAPLTLGFSKDPYFNCFSIVDERSAGFFGLGLAQQHRNPVALVCTSGSALVNYYPAVAEAYYSLIPLIVISADRPPYAIDIGDGQTIRQEALFQNHILYSANCKQDPIHFPEKDPNFISSKQDINGLKALQTDTDTYNEKEIRYAIQKCIEYKGPVHINTPFEEPLYELQSEPSISFKFHRNPTPYYSGVPQEELDFCLQEWDKSERKIVLVGELFPQSISEEILDKLSSDESIIVFTETTSNLNNASFFSNIDKIIAPIEKIDNSTAEFSKLKPDILLTLGGFVISKKIKAFLRKFKPIHHWHVHPTRAYDTYYCLTKHIQSEPDIFLRGLLAKTAPKDSEYRRYWLAIRDLRNRKHQKFLSKVGFCDLKAMETCLLNIPNNYQLQLGNSSTVRYVQLFNINPSIRCFCNRGTSGIDGSTSTAVGASQNDQYPTLLISGDLSFFYDSNGLWNHYLRADFRIIVINNGGGGIFRILPGKENSKEFETFFETAHDHSAEHLCNLYRLDYSCVSDQISLEKELAVFFEISSKPKLLEIFTPRLENDVQLNSYFYELSR